MKIRINIRALWYYLFAIVILTFEFWGEVVNIYIKYILSIPWILYAFATFLKNTYSRRKNITVYHFWLMLFPILVMSLYAFAIWLFRKDVVFGNYTRLCSTIIYLCISWGFGAAGYYFFKEKSVDYLFYAGVTSYFLGSVCCLVFEHGLWGVLEYAKKLFLGIHSPVTHVMEVHDITFAMGIFLLYYLYFEKRSVSHHNAKIILAGLMVFFGLKRIEILALFFAVAVHFIFFRKKMSVSRTSTIFAVSAVLLSFLYLFLIKTGLLSLICMYYGIETSGRLMAYDYARDFFELSPTFTGMGFTYFLEMWENLYNEGLYFTVNGWDYGAAASVHSDIVCLYIENGFLLTIGWIWYSFATKPKLIQKVSGSRSAQCYLLIVAYMFVLYLTDNTFGYHDTQMIFFLAPLVMTGDPSGITDSSAAPQSIPMSDPLRKL